MLDANDRWVHPRIGLAAPSPELLDDCDAAQLEAFHDPALWEDGERGPPPPPMPPELIRAAHDHELAWDGWVGAWMGPREVPFTADDLLRLGPEGLARLMDRYRAWRSAQGLRVLVSCLGMGAMLLWLVVGWRWGARPYLAGMLAVAFAAWLWRPKSMPRGMWEGLDLDRIPRAEHAALQALGEAWAAAAEAVEAMLTADGRLHMRALGRTISIETLRTRFTPEGLVGILEVLVPVEDLPEP